MESLTAGLRFMGLGKPFIIGPERSLRQSLTGVFRPIHRRILMEIEVGRNAGHYVVVPFRRPRPPVLAGGVQALISGRVLLSWRASSFTKPSK